jgi:hypothetical protein
MVNTERYHESTRVLAPASDSVWCTFIFYQQLKLPETRSNPCEARQYRPFHQCTNQVFLPPAPLKLGRTPVSFGTLAISLCGYSRLSEQAEQLIPQGMVKSLGLAGLTVLAGYSWLKTLSFGIYVIHGFPFLFAKELFPSLCERSQGKTVYKCTTRKESHTVIRLNLLQWFLITFKSNCY